MLQESEHQEVHQGPEWEEPILLVKFYHQRAHLTCIRMQVRAGFGFCFLSVYFFSLLSKKVKVLKMMCQEEMFFWLSYIGPELLGLMNSNRSMSPSMPEHHGTVSQPLPVNARLFPSDDNWGNCYPKKATWNEDVGWV